MTVRIGGPSETVEVVGRAAGRIRRFAEAIQQGHDFGLGPGALDSAATIEFHQAAVPIYARSLPWSYLLTLATRFADCADLMATVSAPTELADSWFTMQCYLRSASKAMIEGAPPGVDYDQLATAVELAPQTPPVMPFAALAELLSRHGANELRKAGAAIETAADTIDQSPLTEQETQWLRAIADGHRTIDVAEESGYSERSLYRALSDMWDRLGVDNRTEAIRVATEAGWL